VKHRQRGKKYRFSSFSSSVARTFHLLWPSDDWNLPKRHGHQNTYEEIMNYFSATEPNI